MLIAFNKPFGVICKFSPEPGRRTLADHIDVRDVYPAGRLDTDSEGLLLLTDDGALLHRITSPKSHVPKVYEATLARPLRGDEAEIFASGRLRLESEVEPLLPAELEVLEPRRARLTLHEGRYHQARRMFAAVGNHVETLHRASVGALTLGDLVAGEWRVLGEAERALVFAATSG